MAEMAYAALVSLMHVLEHVLHPVNHWIHLHCKEQMESLLERVCSLVNFLEDYSHTISSSRETADGFESQIEDSCYAAEDIIESFIVDHILAKHADQVAEADFTRFSQDIQKIMEEMSSVEKKANKIKEEKGATKDQQPINTALPQGAAPSTFAPSGKNNTMVGFDDALVRIMDRLTGAESRIQTISIVGMGGIGKTTLARNVLDNKYILQQFYIRAWVTVSQEFTIREVLLGLLLYIDNLSRRELERGEDLASFRDRMSAESDDELAEKLHKTLFGRRYLIVLDDVWSTEVWEEVRRFFPDNGNGSRIMITTRESNVAHHFGSCGLHKMDFLDEDKSWNLFCATAFARESCPLELEQVGKRIAKSCRGLPLAIVAIGGLLAKSDKSKEYWEYVEENLNSVVNLGNDEYCLKLLSLSYRHLPIHLKPCFLHMATFPEDHEILKSKLIKLWVVEGFLKPIRGKSLENVAKEYLNDLIDRNLVLVHQRGATGQIKSCMMHDLVRDLCLREACRGRFLGVTRVDRLGIPPGIESKRRLGVHRSSGESMYPEVLDALQSASRARSFVCESEWVSPQLTSGLRLLRILNVADDYSPEEIMPLVNSRYLAFPTNWNYESGLPSSISMFWNLQTIIFCNSNYIPLTIVLPSEIWEMPHLRHVEAPEVQLPDSPPHSESTVEDKFHILEKLHTLRTIVEFRCTQEFARRVPNLKKMKIFYGPLPLGVEWSYYGLTNLVYLHELESLTCELNGSTMVETDTGRFDEISVRDISFPSSLKKLSLDGLGLPWKDMAIVGSLPNLEALNLRWKAFTGPEWNAEEEQFVRLKYLVIGGTDLKYWTADHTHFPCLEHLVLACKQLEEIPLGFAESTTLQQITLTGTGDSLEDSAKQILEERENLGYEGLLVQVWTHKDEVWSAHELGQ